MEEAWKEHHLSCMQSRRSYGRRTMHRSILTTSDFHQGGLKVLKSVVYLYGPNYIPEASVPTQPS